MYNVSTTLLSSLCSSFPSILSYHKHSTLSEIHVFPVCLWTRHLFSFYCLPLVVGNRRTFFFLQLLPVNVCIFVVRWIPRNPHHYQLLLWCSLSQKYSCQQNCAVTFIQFSWTRFLLSFSCLPLVVGKMQDFLTTFASLCVHLRCSVNTTQPTFLSAAALWLSFSKIQMPAKLCSGIWTVQLNASIFIDTYNFSSFRLPVPP